eukprot:648087-Amphidinium_carterae.2
MGCEDRRGSSAQTHRCMRLTSYMQSPICAHVACKAEEAEYKREVDSRVKTVRQEFALPVQEGGLTKC